MSTPDNYTSVSPGWSDNVPLADLNSALAANAQARAASAQANSDQQFWSTPARPATSPVKEVMEVTLSTARLINRLDFQIANYPHTVLVEYYDEQLADWLPAVSSKNTTAEPVSETVIDSVPGVIPPANAVTGHLHPQHSFSGHWQDVSMRLRPIRVRRLRLVLTRITRGTAPRNTLGQLIDYSLGVNNFNVGYSVTSLADVPRTNPLPGSYTESQPFAATSDILGSAVNYSVRVNKAENVLQNGTGASPTRLIWKCEPQPFPWGVVNFYVDARDADGQPQVIDRFYLEPVTDGPNLNLYYSNDEPTGDFVSGDDPLPPNVGVISGKSGAANVLAQDTVGQVNFVDIDNTVIGFNPGQVWWLGAELTFNYPAATADANHPIFDCPAFSIVMTPLGLRVTTAWSDHVLIETQDYSSAVPVRLLASYDGHVLHLSTMVNGERLDDHVLLTVPLDDATIDSMRVGGFQGSNPGSGSFRLHTMVIKVHEVPDEELVADYLDDPTPYAIKAPLSIDDDAKTNNAILRYDPSTSTPDFPSGFVGGPPDHYAEMTWSPIARDYILRKGFLYLPPTKAKYWKMEFCNLVPAPYEVYVPVKRTVRTYSREMWACQPVMSSSYSSFSFSFAFAGLNSSINLSATMGYKTQTAIRYNPPRSQGYTKTSVRVINDISIQAKVGKAFWAFNFVSWHATTWCPRFEKVCVHTYDYVDIEQKTKVAYFVGLQKVEAYRLNYLAVDDTAQYVEQFHDLANISADSNWTLTSDHQMTSGDSRFAQIDSKPIPTNKMIRAVQFAAVQSLPRQILPDDDFDAQTPDYWEPVGDGHLAASTTEVDILGSVLRIDRSPHPLDWGSLETSPGTWGAFESRGLTYRIVEQLGNPGGEKGGVQSRLYDTPPGGRVHVAARAVTPADLHHPLFVQIVDQSDRVLSESGTTVRTGQVAEWYTSYTVGEGGRILAYRWGDFSVPSTLTRFVDSFDHADAAVLALMDTGQAWTPAMSGTTVLSHAISGNEALQNASATAVDSFSTDTVWGALEFVCGTMGTGTQVPLVVFDPFALSDQGALSFLGGAASGLPSNVFGRPLASGDVVHIDFAPTKFVASNRRDPNAPVDDVSAPYSMLFYLNGVWTSTYSHRLGMRHRKQIQGRANQRFRSIFWTPADYAQPLGRTLWRLPVAALGGSYDAIGATWTDGGGHTWAKLGSWDNSGSRLIAQSTGARFQIDTKAWYGILHARVHRMASGNAANPALHGPLLVLDAENGVTLDVNGYVLANGTAFTRLFPTGIPNDSNISVQFADTKQVAYSVRGNTIDAGLTPRMLIARINGAVVGTWASAKLDEWNGTTRGVAGDTYNNGVDSDGNPVPLPTGGVAADLCTSFDMFDWAPDTSTVSLAPNAPTWDDVTKRGTATFAQASQSQLLEPNRFRARLVQKGRSNDVWEVDTLSMFVEPIVWYFSNDGGQNFYPAYDIRNDPQGVLTFPAQDPSQPYNPNYGQQLVWRAVSYDPKSSISSLVIRPWYAGLVSGVTHRVGVFAGDPNVMPYDHYPDLEADARFQTWSLPIPQDWWYASRILERSKDIPVESPTVFTLPENLISDGGFR